MRSLEPLLLVEDDLGDVMIIKKVLKELEIKNELIHSNNGEEALEYLRSYPRSILCCAFQNILNSSIP